MDGTSLFLTDSFKNLIVFENGGIFGGNFDGREIYILFGGVWGGITGAGKLFRP